MNIFHKVTIESLKKNRTRTIVTIIGIMLSTALICAVTTSASSALDFGRRYFEYMEGYWHGLAENQSYDTYSDILSSDEVDSAVYSKYEGYAEILGENEYKPYLYLMGAGEGFEKMMPVHIIDGEYPKNDSEILIPRHLSENGGVNWKTGEKITLAVGERMRYGHAVGQESALFDMDNGFRVPSAEDEEFVPRITKEYTVCGTYERLPYDIEEYDAPGYTAIVRASDSDIIPESYSVYFTLKDSDRVFDFLEKYGLDGKSNSNLLMFYGTAQYSTFMDMFFWLTVIVIGLIMFGSVMLIYNAFSISVSERTKQFGLLSSVGATKKQIRKMVRFESMAVSVIGIPLGILLGIAGMWVTFTCIGAKFSYFLGNDQNIKMKLSVSVVSLVSAVIIALVTITISAWIPSRRATKISAVEAIRQNKEFGRKNKKVRTPKLVYKIFGLSGMLGHKYYKRSKKRYRTTIVSLFMSIVLFISASAFTEYLLKGVEITSNYEEYEVAYIFSDDNEEESKIFDEIRSLDSVSKAALLRTYGCDCSFDTELLNDEVESLMKMFGGDIGDVYEMYVVMSFVDDESYDSLLKENGLDRSDTITDEGVKAIAYDGGMYFDYNTERYVEGSLLDSDECSFTAKYYSDIDGYYYAYTDEDGMLVYINMETEDEKRFGPEENMRQMTLESIKTVHDMPYFNNTLGSIQLVYPLSEYDNMVLDYGDAYDMTRCIICSDTPNECYEDIKSLLQVHDMNSDNLLNIAESEQELRGLVTIVKVFAYGFIVLISLIAGANVFNTISTNIGLRRREFAMLRSIGMTTKGIQRMLDYECILYGLKSLLLGLPVSALVTYFIYKAVDISMEIGYFLPWKAVLIAAFSVFAVVFATMMYSMSKLKKDDPVDTLKNENI